MEKKNVILVNAYKIDDGSGWAAQFRFVKEQCTPAAIQRFPDAKEGQQLMAALAGNTKEEAIAEAKRHIAAWIAEPYEVQVTDKPIEFAPVKNADGKAQG